MEVASVMLFQETVSRSDFNGNFYTILIFSLLKNK